MTFLVKIVFLSLLLTSQAWAQFGNPRGANFEAGSGVSLGKVYSQLDPFQGTIMSLAGGYQINEWGVNGIYATTEYNNLEEDHFLGSIDHTFNVSLVGVGIRYYYSDYTHFSLNYLQMTTESSSTLTYDFDGSEEDQAVSIGESEQGYGFDVSTRVYSFVDDQTFSVFTTGSLAVYQNHTAPIFSFFLGLRWFFLDPGV